MNFKSKSFGKTVTFLKYSTVAENFYGFHKKVNLTLLHFLVLQKSFLFLKKVHFRYKHLLVYEIDNCASNFNMKALSDDSDMNNLDAISDQNNNPDLM